jgi:putative hemolysin
MKSPLVFLKFSIPLVASALLTLLTVAKSTQILATFTSNEDSTTLSGSVSQARRISNPAAVYCTDLGYAYQITRDSTGGQTDSCTMPDGSTCSAWDFLEGKCGQAYSFCARQGLFLRTATDGKNSFSPDYAVCVDAQGRDVGQLTTLDNLAPKLNRSCGNSEPLGQSSNQTTAMFQMPEPSGQLLATLTVSPPSSWDWRNAAHNGISGNWTTPVKDQGNCGSCWAFAAVGQVEAVLNLAANNPSLDKNLAEEYLVAGCSAAGSCCGGWHNAALDFILNQGIPDEACLPYVSGSCRCSATGTCGSSCQYSINGGCANAICVQRCSDFSGRLSFIDSYGQVGDEQNAPAAQQALIKQALITYGPLSVAMDVSEGDNYWEGDVFKCSNPPDVDHAVVIVGYNDADGYWIVKNSWGSSYQENGFFKVGYGQCLIEKYVFYAHAALITETNNHIFLPFVTH